MHHQLTDRDIVTDCLEGTKHASSTFHRTVIEASNDNIRNACFRMHNDILMMNKTLFDLMHQRGWYQVEPATTGMGMRAPAGHQTPHYAAYRPEMQQFHGPNPGGF